MFLIFFNDTRAKQLLRDDDVASVNTKDDNEVYAAFALLLLRVMPLLFLSDSFAFPSLTLSALSLFKLE